MSNVRFLYMSACLSYHQPGDEKRVGQEKLNRIVGLRQDPNYRNKTEAFHVEYEKTLVRKATAIYFSRAKLFKNILNDIDDHYVMIITTDQDRYFRLFLEITKFDTCLLAKSEKPSLNLNVNLFTPRLNWLIFKFNKDVVESAKKNNEDDFLSFKLPSALAKDVTLTKEFLYA